MAKWGPNQIRDAAREVFDLERRYADKKHHGNTCSNPEIPFEEKLHWLTEEYLEVVTAHNDREPEHDKMHEIVQLGSMCQAIIENHLIQHPEFVNYVAHKRHMETQVISNGLDIVVRETCPDAKLRGFVGSIVEISGSQAKVEFRVAIRNQVTTAWVSMDDLALHVDSKSTSSVS